MTNLSALSIAELKTIATQLDCTLSGDKRRKQSWIDAIEIAKREQALMDELHGQLSIQFDTIESEQNDDYEVHVEEWDLFYKEVADDADAKLFVDTFGKSVDEPWDSTEICGESLEAQQEAIDRAADIQQLASTKKGSVSVVASIVCLLIFALTALCQILSVSIKYGCLLVMLFGRWNPNLDIWYQLTSRTTSKRLSTASA